MAPPKKGNQNKPRRVCPPPLIRSPKTGKCVPPPRFLGGSPFGGPATSPFGFGNAGVQSQPSAAPTPTPTPTCTDASIFSDCFALCAGMIDEGSPGPVCGWTFIEPFGPTGGQFAFTPGIMSMDTFDADDFPIAAKPLSAPLASVFGISGQFSFTEYPTPPNALTTYQLLLNNTGLTESFNIVLFGDGNLVFQLGDPTNSPTYTGTWAPVAGADHTVYFAIDGVGVPTLIIDGVAIPLIFLANVPSFATLFPAGVVTYGGGAADITPASSPVRNIFITAGVTAPETVFCCP